jgi:hypothetical protein
VPYALIFFPFVLLFCSLTEGMFFAFFRVLATTNEGKFRAENTLNLFEEDFLQGI